MNRKSIVACWLVVLAVSTAAVAQERPVRADLSKVRADLAAIAKGGYITRDDARALAEQVRAAAPEGFTQEEQDSIVQSARSLAAQIPSDLLDALKADLEQLKADARQAIGSRVPQDVKDAAARVRADLEAIARGGYVSREDGREIRDAARSALADGALTDTEKAQIEELIRSKAAQVPEELRTQLKADMEALQQAVQSHR